MALKYTLQYTDTIGKEFRAEIFDVRFIGEPSEIRGNAVLEYAKVERVLECFRGSMLTLNLEADSNIDLTDLYSEDETDLTVDFYINEVISFKGFVKPDGIYTDFVNEIYTISLDCIDGLGVLKNLSFVNTFGGHFVGFMKEIDIVYNCLRRTSIPMPINVDISVFHEGIMVSEESTIDVLNATKLSADRFYKDDSKDNIMDCDEVLRSVLEKYCAIVHQYNGEWYVYRPQDVAVSKELEFYRYVDGVYDLRLPVQNIAFEIGSQIDSYYPHHCSGNQRININGSVSAFRVHYKYGLLKGFFNNANLEWTGSLIDGWDILPDSQFTQFSADGGIRWNGEAITYGDPEIESQDVNVIEGDSLRLKLEFYSIGYHNDLYVTIKITDSTQTKYFNGSEWVDSFTTYGSWVINNGYTVTETCEINGGETEFDEISYGSGALSFSQPITPAPFDGQMTIIVNGVNARGTILGCIDPPAESYSYITQIGFLGESISAITKGEFHTAIRQPRSSSIVEDNITIYNGDMESDIYEGTIKNLSNVNTSSWRHKGSNEDKKILQIMVEDTVKARIKPQKLFIGDTYGSMPFLSVFKINNIEGNLLPLSYRYDTSKNIVSLELVEVSDYSNQNIDYEMSIDYGNVVKPTIV